MNRYFKKRVTLKRAIAAFVALAFFSPSTLGMFGGYALAQNPTEGVVSDTSTSTTSTGLPKIGVFELEDKSGSKVADLSKKMADSITLSLAQSGSFEVVETSKLMEALKSKGGKPDTLTSVRVGKELGLKYVGIGTIARVEVSKSARAAHIYFTLEVYETATSELIVKAISKTTSGSKPGYEASEDALLAEAIATAGYDVVDDILNNMGTSGVIVSTRDGKILVNLGKYHKLNQGAELAVTRGGLIVARLVVVKVSNRDSLVEIVRRKPGISVDSGDSVVVVSNPKPDEIQIESKPEVVKAVKKKKKFSSLLVTILLVGAAAYFATSKKKSPTQTATGGPLPAVSGTTVSASKQAGADGVVGTSDDVLTMVVNWTPASDARVTGYYVYRAAGTESGPTTEFKLVHDTQGIGGEPPFVDAGTDVAKAVLPFQQPSFVKAKLTEGTKYFYKIVAHDAAGTQGSQPPTTATTPAAVAGAIAKPKAPVLGNPSYTGGGKISLTWTPPTQRIDGTNFDSNASDGTTDVSFYHVYVKKDSDASFSTSPTAVLGQSTASAEITGLDKDTIYNFAVTVKDNAQPTAQESDKSNTRTITVLDCIAPPQPTGLVVAPGGVQNQQITILWNDKAADVTAYEGTPPSCKFTGYKIYFATNTAAFDSPGTLTPESTSTDTTNETVSYTVKNLTNNTKYFFRVKAYTDDREVVVSGSKTSAALEGNFTSETLSAIPVGAGGTGGVTDTPPGAPTSVQAQPKNQALKLTWVPPTDLDLSGLRIYRTQTNPPPSPQPDAQGNDPGYTFIASVGKASTTYTDFGLQNTQQYFYYMLAVDAAGQLSQASEVITGIPSPPVPPAAPAWSSTPNPVVPAATSITLNWLAVTKDVNGNDLTSEAPLAKYKVFRSVGSDFSSGANGDYQEISPVGGVLVPNVSYTDSNLGANPETKWYFYRVQAILSGDTAGPQSEYRFGQVGLPALVLFSPEKGAWKSATQAHTHEKDEDLCGTGGIAHIEKWTIEFLWNPVNGATRYVLEIGFDPNMSTLDRNVEVEGQASNNTSGTWDFRGCADMGPVNYWWRVKAVNDLGVAFATSEVRAFTLATNAPATSLTSPNAPTGITAVAAPPDQVTVNWTPPTANTDGSPLAPADIAGYNVYYAYAISPNDFGLATQVFGGSTTATISLTPGVSYFIKVSTLNTSGREGTMSNSAAPVTVGAKEPKIPTNLVVAQDALGQKQLELCWQAPTQYTDGSAINATDGDIASYNVYKGGQLLTTVGPADNPTGCADAHSYEDNGVTFGTPATYAVTAVTTIGAVSGQSAPKTATAFDQCKPVPPITVTVRPNDSYNTVSWTWPANFNQDIRGFRVYCNLSAAGDETTPAAPDPLGTNGARTSDCTYNYSAAPSTDIDTGFTPGTTTYNFTHPGLDNTRVYVYQVSAVNFSDTSAVACSNPANDGVESAFGPGVPVIGLPMSSSQAPVPANVTAVPSLVQVGQTGIGHILVGWDTVGVDVTGYHVYVAQDGGSLTTNLSMANGHTAALPKSTPDVANYSLDVLQFGQQGGLQSLAAGGTYFVAVRAYRQVDLNGDGQLQTSETIEGSFTIFGSVNIPNTTETGAPAAPCWEGSVCAEVNPISTIGSNKVVLSWLQVTSHSDICQYQVLRCTGNPCTPSAVITTVPSAAGISTYNYTDNTASNGTIYNYRIRVFRTGTDPGNDCDDDAGSTEDIADGSVRSATPAPAAPPSTPIFDSVISNTDALVLDWQDSANAVRYKIYRSANGEFGQYQEIDDANDNIPPLSGVKYDNATPGCTITTTGASAGVLAPCTNYMDMAGEGPASGFGCITGSEQECQTYYYKVSAVNADGQESALSTPRSGKPTPIQPSDPAPVVALSPLNGVQMQTFGNGSSNIVWTKYSSAGGGYKVTVANDSGMTNIFQVSIESQCASSTCTLTFTQVPPGVFPLQICYTIEAIDSSGNLICDPMKGCTKPTVDTSGQGSPVCFIQTN